MPDLVTREEMNNHLTLMNERTDTKFDQLVTRMEIVAEHTAQMVKLVQDTNNDHSAKIQELIQHKTKTDIYWKLVIFMSSAAFLAAMGSVAKGIWG